MKIFLDMEQLKTNFLKETTEAFILHVELLQGVVLPVETLVITLTLSSEQYLAIAQTETMVRTYY